MAENQGGNDFPTIIGPDASFKGELTFEKGLRLMGKFEGKINAGGRLHVAREARMAADVEGAAIVVEGEVNHDAAWYYPTTKPAAAEIAGYVAFWTGVQIEEDT